MTEERNEALRQELLDAHDQLESVRAEITSIGRDDLERLSDTLLQLDRLLHDYEDRATGTGDFGGYIAFRQQVEELVEDLPSSFPHRDAFETVAERVDKRRLSERDFEAMRETIADARTTAGLLDDEEQAETEYRDLRRTVIERIDEIDDRLDHMDNRLALADVDLDAPVEEIRKPIQSYNTAVAEDFATYLETTPASAVLDLFAMSGRYPLVPMTEPPEQLHTYLEELPEPLTIAELLEYVDYSASKLAHYVEDPDALVTAVAMDRTYLERLSADPFQISWPPSPSDTLAWRIRELIPLVNRFGEDETVALLREVRDRTNDSDRFDHLRDVAVARSTIDRNERERIQSGDFEKERAQLADQRDRLAKALEDTPAIRR